jgi:hypothetical protein
MRSGVNPAALTTDLGPVLQRARAANPRPAVVKMDKEARITASSVDMVAGLQLANATRFNVQTNLKRGAGTLNQKTPRRTVVSWRSRHPRKQRERRRASGRAKRRVGTASTRRPWSTSRSCCSSLHGHDRVPPRRLEINLPPKDRRDVAVEDVLIRVLADGRLYWQDTPQTPKRAFGHRRRRGSPPVGG